MHCILSLEVFRADRVDVSVEDPSSNENGLFFITFSFMKVENFLDTKLATMSVHTYVVIAF
jgi:hypothetical protein